MLRLTFVVALFIVAIVGLQVNAKLIGVHFDVEPHALNEWDTSWASTATQFLELVQSLSAQKQNMKISLDMNCDFDGAQCPNDDCSIAFNGATKPVSSHVQDMCDRVVLMAYFQDGEAMLTRTSGEMAYAEAHKSSSADLIVGANLKPTDSDSETFWPNVDEMETAFDQVFDAYGAMDKFDGFAVHHYGYWRTLNPDSLDNTKRNRREMYWWCGSSSGGADSELCDIYEQDARDALVSFVVDHAVHVVYIDAPAIVALAQSAGSCSADLAVLEALIDRLNKVNVDVELIYGAPDWALTANHQKALDALDNVHAFVLLCGISDSGEQEQPDEDQDEDMSSESNASSSLMNPWTIVFN